MDDLVNLTQRVIVINEGRIIFDGGFAALIEQYAKEKIIKVSLAKENDVKKLDKIGKVVKFAFPQVILSVARGSAAVAAAEILQDFPVADLTIEEVPVEDIIRQVFKDKPKK